MNLLTVGTVAFDTIHTPFGKAERVIGGAATYISWAASYFTNNQQLVSIVGDDFPEEELQALHARGVDLSGLEIVPGKKSFFWEGTYHDNMNSRETLVTELNVLADFNPTLPDAYRNTEYVMLGNLTPEIQRSVLEQMDHRPKIVAMDTMNFWMDVAMVSLKETINQVDVLIINDEEARQLSGEYSLVKAAQIIRAMGPKYLVIKKGEHGALLFHKKRMFFAPGLPLAEVYDPTGAGDSFAGGFMGYLAMSDDTSFENFKRALIYGSVMASFCVEDFSINNLQNLSKESLKKRLKEFVDIVNFKVY